MNEDVLKNLQSEFKLWGVKPTIEYLKSGHIELSWQASPDKPERRHVIAKTGSDWRGWLNSRAIIRRQFKADNLSVIEQCKKASAKPAIVKALAAPEPVERDADQIKILRGEVADLSELMLAMMSMVKELIAAIPVQETSAPPPMLVTQPAPVPRAKTIDYVSESWNSTDALARAMEVQPLIAYRKLNYLLKKGLVELSGGRWRKKPKLVEENVAIVAQTRKRVNGHKGH